MKKTLVKKSEQLSFKKLKLMLSKTSFGTEDIEKINNHFKSYVSEEYLGKHGPTFSKESRDFSKTAIKFLTNDTKALILDWFLTQEYD